MKQNQTAQLFKFFGTIVLGAVIFVSTSIKVVSAQTPSFDDLQDLLNTFDPEELGAHIISFTLPPDSQQVNPTDYITFRFFNYTDVAAPDSITGTYTGTPTYQVVDKTLYVSGITIAPGSSISFNGIKARNPIYMYNLYVIIQVVEDFDGTIIKNSSTVVPNQYDPWISVSATVGTPLSELQISGFSAPLTQVIFNAGLTTLGTAYTGLDGYFSRLFTGMYAGTHAISFYGIDDEDRATSTISVSLDSYLYERTTLGSQLLSPTIEVDDTEIEPGEPIYATGSAYPNTTITLLTDSPLRSYATTADANGYWSHTITDSNTYSPGDYRIYTMAQTNSGLQSLFSPAVLFSITASGVDNTVACGDIIEGDLDCDGNINLTDFSILMYYWGTISQIADTNSDGQVDLYDFSVMMYYWGS